MLIFDPVRHTYKNEFTGDIYTSVTTLLSKFKKPFDSKTAAERVAKREGCTVEEILDKWKKLNVDSQVYGTNIHQAIEDFNNTGKIDEDYADILNSYVELGVIDRQKDNLLCEERVYSHIDKLAGTADIIRLEDKGAFSIFDIKTNKKFNLYSQYNERLLYPLNHLCVSEFTTYSLQLSLYAYMYQNLTGRNVNQLGIFYYNREEKKFIYYPVVYMKGDVVNLLKFYGESKLGRACTDTGVCSNAS